MFEYCSPEYSNIRYIHLIIGNVQNHVWSNKNGFQESAEITFPLQIGICYISPYNQIIKRNNQIHIISQQCGMACHAESSGAMV